MTNHRNENRGAKLTPTDLVLSLADILFTLFLFISAAFDLLCPAVPWVVKQLIAAVFLMGLSLAVAIRHWSTYYFYIRYKAWILS